MFLKINPTLAEAPDFSPEDLEHTIRQVEAKKLKLEEDIKSYIRMKQDELTKYGQELMKQNQDMIGAANHEDNATSMDSSQSPPPAVHPASRDSDDNSPSDSPGPGEDAGRIKQTRVHKREKELHGVVTPIFLPLLEARDPPPTKKKRSRSKHKEGRSESKRPSSGGSRSSSPTKNGVVDRTERAAGIKSKDKVMDASEIATEPADSQKQEKENGKEKKAQRLAIKKSSLRRPNTPKEQRRKRVSLVIDDQIVHPSDSLTESRSYMPSSEPSNSTTVVPTASSDMALDPRLFQPVPSHHEPVHHSLPMPVTVHSAVQGTDHLSSSPPPLDYEPQTAARAYPDPPASALPASLPQYASVEPMYPTDLLSEEEEALSAAIDVAPSSTYVGGLSGAGMDDVDQSGSYGYPSSLGASYMESYMAGRPLSVRIAAAEKSGMSAEEVRALRQQKEEEEDADLAAATTMDEGRDEDMDILGDMEGF